MLFRVLFILKLIHDVISDKENIEFTLKSIAKTLKSEKHESLCKKKKTGAYLKTNSALLFHVSQTMRLKSDCVNGK